MSDKNRSTRNPSLWERIRAAGGLGVSPQVESDLNNSGILNRTVTRPIANAAMGALQVAGHGIDWVSEEADQRWKGSKADKITSDVMRVHMRPSELIGGMAEAFPMGFPEGSSVQLGALSSRASQAGRTASRRAAPLAREIARDTSGELRVTRAAREEARAPARARTAPKASVVPKTPDRPTAAPQGPLSTKAIHYSHEPKLTETDPSKWGTNPNAGFLSREERATMAVAPKRTYFGLKEGEGVTQPYSKERGLGPYQYEADLPTDRFFDADGDKSWITNKIGELPRNAAGRYEYNGRSYDGGSITEQLIKDEGYAGYRTNNRTLGDVAVGFEPQAVRRVELPIEGAPTKLGPYDPLRDAAREYASTKGIEYNPPAAYKQIDEANSTALANAYTDMKHDPFDPDVAEAYGALKSETVDQLTDLQNRGYKFSFDDPDNPYASPYDAVRDLRDNKRMKVFPTDEGFGEGEGFADHPLLDRVPDIEWDGKPITYNDAFRAVHDAHGHAKEGYGFRATGEENAAFQHLPMFTPAAQRAALSELRGQNSHVNYGPNGEFNRTASAKDTIYAPQKAGLLPDNIGFAGTEDFLPAPRSTAYGSRENVNRGGALSLANVRDGAGFRAFLAERGVELPQPKAPGAPAIIQSRQAPVADWGYDPSYTSLKRGGQVDDIGFTETGMAPRQALSPEDLQGSRIVGSMSDRSRAGGILSSVNGRELRKPVTLDGGIDFPREQAAKGGGSAWASAPGQITGILNKGRDAKDGFYHAPFILGGEGVDFSNMMGELSLNALAGAPMSARKALDAAIRQNYPEFLGTSTINRADNFAALQQQMSGSSELRMAVTSALDKKPFMDQGIDIGALRKAMTEPSIAGSKTGGSGQTLSKIEPGATPVRDPTVPHGTYDAYLPGQYAGGFDRMVPPNIMFPDYYNDFVANGGMPPSLNRKMQMSPPAQDANQEWLDGIMGWMEREKAAGR